MTAKAQLAIVGLPGSGKTTLSIKLVNALNLTALHTDDYAWVSWAEQPDAAMAGIAELLPDGGIVEGFTVCRMFKRGFEPDCVLYILGCDEKRTPKGLRTQLERGLDLYAGRVITLPKWPSLETALWALGTPDE